MEVRAKDNFFTSDKQVIVLPFCRSVFDKKQQNNFSVFLSSCSDTLTAPFNNMRTLKFKAQPTNAFFATVNQMCPTI